MDPVKLPQVAYEFCALSMVQGQFKGDSEFVQIVRKGGDQYLEGGSQTHGVAAEALCFSYNQR
jgi:hypothetical protein